VRLQKSKERNLPDQMTLEVMGERVCFQKAKTEEPGTAAKTKKEV